MIGKLLGKISLLGHWGYAVIFLAAFFESSAINGMNPRASPGTNSAANCGE